MNILLEPEFQTLHGTAPFSRIKLEDYEPAFIEAMKQEDEAIEAIADMAIERKTGARGLRSIMEKVMMEEMFEIPSDTTIIEVVVTKDSVLGNARPRIIRRQTRKKAAPALPAGEAGALKEAN